MAKYRLGDIAPVKQGIVPDSDQYWLLNLDAVESNTGNILEYVYVDYSQIGASTVSFNQQNVLYSKLRPYLNKVVLPDRAGYATSEMLPLMPNEKVITREYLTFFLRSSHFVEYINGKTSGAKMPRANTADLKAVEMECPPINEQNRIVSQINSILTIIAHRKNELSRLDELIRARFVEMFGDPVNNEKDWNTKPLLSMGSCKNGMNFHYDDSGVEINCLGVGDYKKCGLLVQYRRLNCADPVQRGTQVRALAVEACAPYVAYELVHVLQRKGIHLRGLLGEEKHPGAFRNVGHALYESQGEFRELYHGAGHVAEQHEPAVFRPFSFVFEPYKAAACLKAFADGALYVQRSRGRGLVLPCGELAVYLAAYALYHGYGSGHLGVVYL